MRSDAEIMLIVAKGWGLGLKYGTMEVKNNEEVVKAAIN